MSKIDDKDQELRLSDEEFRAVRKLAQTIHFADGDRVFGLGDVGDCMYMVFGGEVEIRFSKDLPAKRLRTGAVFGELALILGEHRRTATAIAVGPSELALVDEDSFGRLVLHQPQILTSVLRRACRYLLNSEQRLVAELKRSNNELKSTLNFLRRTREELNYQELLAQTDGMTGLYNRRCLDEQLPRFLERSQQSGEPMALLLIDLDKLKPLNDTCGHAAGDQFIVGAANAIRRCIRSSDLACRIGGDEFAVVLPGIEPAEAKERAETIRLAIAAVTDEVDAPPGWQASASLGGACPTSGDCVTAFLERVDCALYSAKSAGGNRAVWVP